MGMVQMMLQRAFRSDRERWRAVLERDRAADGAFVYAVKSTGIYCRPSCAARRARRENVEFFGSAETAERAGFRACKRCRPEAMENGSAEVVKRACEMIGERGVVSLTELARGARMSVSHFHRVFRNVMGVTPKGFMAARRAGRVREELAKGGTVTRAMYRAGFGSGARFYAEAREALGMRPREFRKRGKGIRIRFAVGECSLGAILVAATDVGICAISFGDDAGKLVRELEEQFSEAELVGGDRRFERMVARVVGFVERPATGLALPLDVRGTAFQRRVWEELRKIPCGETWSYTEIAKRVGRKGAVRAVAQACGANRIAVAIPCHRVVRRDGGMAGYRWGVERKVGLLKRERAGG